MRARTLLTALSFVAALAAGTPAAQAPEPWPELPPGTRTLVLATGSDFGYLRPKACHEGAGGALYRYEFDRWLARREPGIDRVWVATGNVGPFENEGSSVVALNAMHAELARAGYAFAGLGIAELSDPGPIALLERRRLPLLAANLRVFETGASPFPAGDVRVLGGVRVLFVALAPHRPGRVWGSPSTGAIVTVPEADALRAELDRRQGTFDRVVLLSATTDERLAAVLAAEHRIDVVLTSAGVDMAAEPVVVHGIPVLRLGGEGLLLGRVALGEGGQPLEIVGIPVGPGFPVDPTSGTCPD